ncbi:MAG: tetratricopeptide repeat protein [Methylobacteriaceae bacterium]|nr:tetratricopeptide repeat protein [Methylobacteriaceae bacterium]
MRTSLRIDVALILAIVAGGLVCGRVAAAGGSEAPTVPPALSPSPPMQRYAMPPAAGQSGPEQVPPSIAARPEGPFSPGTKGPAATPAAPQAPASSEAKGAAAGGVQRILDDLFSRLAKSTDAEESQGIAGAIERAWMHSGSDTADLLMDRALNAIQTKDLPLAEQLLGSVIAVEPDWPEGWNKRATVRYMADNDSGAMEDIAQVLKREPRHFGALSGMGFILQRAGLNKAALKTFRKALEVYPQLEKIRTIVDKLTIDVEGRDL